MIPKECKRLAEVDFPIAEVSRHAVREKSIRHGHPSTLHLWWARRPLASSRAVLMALLLPDPCDEHCPAAFKEEARRVLLAMHGRARGWTEAVESDGGLRGILLKFIADFANWDKAADPDYLKTSRALVQAAHGGEPPLVVDPFAGGGSIPLEALRVGCEAFASDLNPVACLILKVMLEDIPRHGPKLAEELREAGRRIKEQAERELADLYPKDPDGATPIAHLWARTVRCEAPDCGAEIPLMRSFWLCKGAFSRGARGGTPRKKKSKRRRALRPRVLRCEGEPPEVAFEVFNPTSERDVHRGTVDRAKATCLCCGAVLPPERVRLQLSEQRGGADAIFDDAGKRIGGALMTAVVTLRAGEAGRHYRLPTAADYAAVQRAQARLVDILSEWEGGTEGKGGTEWEGGIKAESCTAPASVKGPVPNASVATQQRLCPVPDEPLPPIGTLGFRVQRYGMLQWGDLFAARQALSLLELGSLTMEYLCCKRSSDQAILFWSCFQLFHICGVQGGVGSGGPTPALGGRLAEAPPGAGGVLGRFRRRRLVPAARSGRPEPVVAEQDVGEQEQLAHDGRQGDLPRLAVGDQPPVLGGQVGIAADGAQRRHVKKPPHPCAAALDAAAALPAPRLARHRGDPREAGRGLGVESAQFRHVDDESGDGDRAEAGNGGQHLGAPRQRRVFRQQPADAGVQGFELAVDLRQPVAVPPLSSLSRTCFRRFSAATRSLTIPSRAVPSSSRSRSAGERASTRRSGSARPIAARTRASAASVFASSPSACAKRLASGGVSAMIGHAFLLLRLSFGP